MTNFNLRSSSAPAHAMPPAGTSLRWSAPIMVVFAATVSFIEVACDKRRIFHHTTGTFFGEKGEA